MAAVVVDTNVFGADLRPAGWPLAEAYAELIGGRSILLSFVTVAELDYGARRAGWGDKRRKALDHLVNAATIVWPGPGLLQSYAKLRAVCAEHGHGLADPRHEADRWIAATAHFLRVPLVTNDGVFRDAPGLEVLTLLD